MDILIIADYSPGANAPVVADFLFAFHRYSENQVYHWHWPSRSDADIDFNRFDAVIIHWACYFVDPLPPIIESRTLSPEIAERLAASTATKFLFLQDEYSRVEQVRLAMRECGINHVMTCIPHELHDVLYPKSEIPSLQGVHTVLTGYVSNHVLDLPEPMLDRPIEPFIGYRSRPQPFERGALAHAKEQICDVFQSYCEAHGIRCDLSVDEGSRLYGKKWWSFLAQTDIQLGTPSGASLIDFDGSIAELVADYRRKHPYSDFAEVSDACFPNTDGKHVIDVLSPRVFEYAGTGNLMVMTEGAYGGTLKAGQHYVEVKSDFSNLDDVFRQVRDKSLADRIRKHAYEDLVASGRYSYSAFVRRFDDLLRRDRSRLTFRKRDSMCPPLLFHIDMSKNHGQVVLPIAGREIVVAEILPDQIKVFLRKVRYGVHYSHALLQGISVKVISVLVSLSRAIFEPTQLPRRVRRVVAKVFGGRKAADG